MKLRSVLKSFSGGFSNHPRRLTVGTLAFLKSYRRVAVTAHACVAAAEGEHAGSPLRKPVTRLPATGNAAPRSRRGRPACLPSSHTVVTYDPWLDQTARPMKLRSVLKSFSGGFSNHPRRLTVGTPAFLKSAIISAILKPVTMPSSTGAPITDSASGTS